MTSTRRRLLSGPLQGGSGGVGWVWGGEQMAKYSSMSSFPTTRDGASRQIPKMKRSVMNKS